MQIKQLLLTVLVFKTIFFSNIINAYTIMIDPSGDAKHTGRVIEDTFERGITLQCAEKLKAELNKILPQVRVILTRVPGETIQPLQNASFANRLQVDLYLSIYFYPEADIPSHLSIFHYLIAATDLWHQYNPLSFYHINQSHLINIEHTKKLGEMLLNVLQDTTNNPFFAVKGLFAVPFKPLLGIKAPALAIEAGLSKKNDWQHLVKPLVLSIKEIVT